MLNQTFSFRRLLSFYAAVLRHNDMSCVIIVLNKSQKSCVLKQSCDFFSCSSRSFFQSKAKDKDVQKTASDEQVKK